MSAQPDSRTVRVRAVLTIGAILAAGTLALALILHAPFVRSAVLRYVLATVQRDYGLALEVERLDYNLAALRVGLDAVRLSVPGSTGEPFFEAEYLSITLPPGAQSPEPKAQRRCTIDPHALPNPVARRRQRDARKRYGHS